MHVISYISSGSTCLLEVVIHANHILLKTSSQEKNDVTDDMVWFSFFYFVLYYKLIFRSRFLMPFGVVIVTIHWKVVTQLLLVSVLKYLDCM